MSVIGQDVINNYANHHLDDRDIIRFGADIEVFDIVVKRADDSLFLSDKSGANTLLVDSYYVSDNRTIFAVEFADSTVWSKNRLEKPVQIPTAWESLEKSLPRQDDVTN